MHTYACQHFLTTGMWTTFFDGRGFAEHQSSLLWSVSETPHNSWTLLDIWIKFCVFIYFILSSHLYAKRWRGFVEHHFGRSRSFSENAHNSLTASCNLIKFCIRIHFNIIETPACTHVTRLRHYFIFINRKTLAYAVQHKWISSLVTRIYMHATLLCSSSKFFLNSHQATVNNWSTGTVYELNILMYSSTENIPYS